MLHRSHLRPLAAAAIFAGLSLAAATAAVADPMTMSQSANPSNSNVQSGAASHFEVEGDPTDYFQGGYSAWVGYKPAALPQWRFALGSFGANLPTFLAPSGWSVHEAGYGAVGAHWYPSSDRRGWYFGGLAAYVQSTFTNTAAPGKTAAIGHLSLVPAVGYQWFPLGDHFYVEPWLGVSVNLPLGSEPTLAGQTVPDTMVNPLPAIHVGWEF